MVSVEGGGESAQPAAGRGCEGGSAGGEAGGTTEGQAAHPISYSLLSMTSQRVRKQTHHASSYLSHCFAAIGGSVFLFYDVIYCHVRVLIFS